VFRLIESGTALHRAGVSADSQGEVLGIHRQRTTSRAPISSFGKAARRSFEPYLTASHFTNRRLPD
jgi:hypothetical protein